jgi:hypothetical protein
MKIGSLFLTSMLLIASAPAQSTPEVFAPGVISTGDYESSSELSPDGNTLYFLRNSPDFNFWTIYVSHRKGNTWSRPEIAPFSGQYVDADPYITTDNKHFYFISNRPIDPKSSTPRDNLDIWKMDRLPNGDWSSPQHLPAPLNSDKDEFYPRTASDGTLYFGSARDGGFGATDIYRAKLGANREYTQPENLGPNINTAEHEYEPLIAPDQSWLIVMANRKEGLGRGDLYISYQQNGAWTKLKNLGAPINSDGYELGATITRDGKHLMFTSSRATSFPPKSRMTTAEHEQKLHSPGNGLGDIYTIDLSDIPLKP